MPPSPNPLETADLSVSVVLPFFFSKCHVPGIIKYVAFWELVLSLSKMHLNFFNALHGLIVDLFLVVFRHQDCYTLSLHSSKVLGIFQILIIMNKAVINISVKLLKCRF